MNANKAKSGRSPVGNVTLHFWSTYRPILIWFWAIFTVIFVTINELIMRGYIADEPVFESGSIWNGAASSPRIFLLVVGILLTVGSFNSFVSNGITRRSFGKAGLLFAALMSVVCAVVHLLGYPIERFVVDISGAERVLQHPDLFVVAITNLLMFFGYFCAGWLIGTGFYRFHWFKGLLVCLLTVVFVMGLEALAVMDQMEGFGADVAFKLLGIAAICALIAWMNHSFLRKVVVKRKITL